MKNNITLINGRVEDEIGGIESGSINLVLGDPPYGTTAQDWDKIIDFNFMWTALRRVVAKDAPIILFGSNPFTALLIVSNLKEYKYSWIWDKKLAGNALNSNYQPLKIHEDINVFKPGSGPIKYRPIMRIGRLRHTTPDPVDGKINSTFGEQEIKDRKKSRLRKPVSILSYYMQRTGRVHTTQKPVNLLEYLIRTYTDPGDMVLDFCMGSGSTGEAAVRTGRGFIGIEPNEEYYNYAKERVSLAELQPSLLNQGITKEVEDDYQRDIFKSR